MIDPATGWFEMHQIENKAAAEVADTCGKTWFTRHPLPQRSILNRGTEFMAEFARMVKNDYGLKLKPITTRNAIIERVHQTIRNVIRTFNVQPSNGLQRPVDRNASSYYVCSMSHVPHHTQASPMQLAFERDAILNIKQTSDWEHIRQQKQIRINDNNRRRINLDARS
jgi:hypothetical protein